MEVFAELEGQATTHDILRRVYTTGERFVCREFAATLRRSTDGALEERYFDLVFDPFTEQTAGSRQMSNDPLSIPYGGAPVDPL